MFVNDTSRLPESGRICVAGFRAAPGGARNYYSLFVDSAHAEVERMNEPRNLASVLGVGAGIQSVRGTVFAAYFAASRERFDAEPNYGNGLYALVDGSVYAVADEGIGATIRRGLTTREFTLLRGGRPQRSVEYAWPWYKEPFAQAKPGHVRSGDFLRELSAMIESYGGRTE
jgi:hypothetical protein